MNKCILLLVLSLQVFGTTKILLHKLPKNDDSKFKDHGTHLLNGNVFINPESEISTHVVATKYDNGTAPINSTSILPNVTTPYEDSTQLQARILKGFLNDVQIPTDFSAMVDKAIEIHNEQKQSFSKRDEKHEVKSFKKHKVKNIKKHDVKNIKKHKVKYIKKHQVKSIKAKLDKAHQEIIENINRIKVHQKKKIKNRRKHAKISHKIVKDLAKTLKQLHPKGNNSKNARKLNKLKLSNEKLKGLLVDIPEEINSDSVPEESSEPTIPVHPDSSKYKPQTLATDLPLDHSSESTPKTIISSGDEPQTSATDLSLDHLSDSSPKTIISSGDQPIELDDDDYDDKK